MAVASRRHTRLPPDECLYTLQGLDPTPDALVSPNRLEKTRLQNPIPKKKNRSTR